MSEPELTSDAFNQLFVELEDLLKQTKALSTRFRSMHREIVHMEKKARKADERKNRRRLANLDENGNKKKNGFSLENNLISDELSDFIGWERGKPISRGKVTSLLSSYVKDNGLQYEKDRRIVKLDSEAGQKLKDLLSDIVDAEGNPTDLTIITMNKFIKKHFVGKVDEPSDDSQVSEPESSETVAHVEPPAEEIPQPKDLPEKKKKLKKPTA